MARDEAPCDNISFWYYVPMTKIVLIALLILVMVGCSGNGDQTNSAPAPQNVLSGDEAVAIVSGRTDNTTGYFIIVDGV